MKWRHYSILTVSLLACCFLLHEESITADNEIREAAEGSPAGIIYVVFAIDTEPVRFSPWRLVPELDFSTFADTGRNAHIASVMDTAWRNQYRDVRQHPPKFTWFVMSHEAFFHADDCGCAPAYDSLMKFNRWIERFDDEIGWHYHHADWIDLNRDGIPAWNQLTTFDGSRYTHGTDVRIAERALGCLLAEKNIFPTAFRSGWVWEDNRFSKWLESVFPYDYSNNPGHAEPDSRTEPARNVYDWSRAPRSYSGYHPDAFDYQYPGGMRRWIFRTLSPRERRQWNRIFRAANDGALQIFCFTAHSYDNLRKDIDGFLGDFLRAADSAGIAVHFATASEAGAARAGAADSPPPEIAMAIHDSIIDITVTGPIFQPYPFCVAQLSPGTYNRVLPVMDKIGHWRLRVPTPEIKNVTCAVSSLSGKSASTSITIP